MRQSQQHIAISCLFGSTPSTLSSCAQAAFEKLPLVGVEMAEAEELESFARLNLASQRVNHGCEKN